MKMGKLQLTILSPFCKNLDKLVNFDELVLEWGRFAPVLNYIEENFSHKISINKLAKLMYLHPNYFSSLFKQKFGISPQGYICQRRIEKAQSIMTQTDKKMQEIAAEVGYDDEFYFPRIFKKYAGISPRDYRKQNRNFN